MRAIVFALDRADSVCETSGPKCLLRVRGRTLLERVMTSVQYAGVREVICVVGDDAPQVIASCHGFNPNLTIDYVHVRGDDRSDGAGLHAARHRLDGDILLLSADWMFSFPLLEPLVHAPGGGALLVDPQRRSVNRPRVVVEDGRVRDVLPAGEQLVAASGECVGPLVLNASGAHTLRAILDGIGAPPDLAITYQRLVACHEVHGLSIAGIPWMRIDSPSDWSDLVDRGAWEIVRWEVAFARRS